MSALRDLRLLAASALRAGIVNAWYGGSRLAQEASAWVAAMPERLCHGAQRCTGIVAGCGCFGDRNHDCLGGPALLCECACHARLAALRAQRRSLCDCDCASGAKCVYHACLAALRAHRRSS